MSGLEKQVADLLKETERLRQEKEQLEKEKAQLTHERDQALGQVTPSLSYEQQYVNTPPLSHVRPNTAVEAASSPLPTPVASRPAESLSQQSRARVSMRRNALTVMSSLPLLLAAKKNLLVPLAFLPSQTPSGTSKGRGLRTLPPSLQP